MNIRIKNVSRNVTANSLTAIFSTYGNVTSATIHSHTDIAGENNTALVRMPDVPEATRAIEQLNGCFVDGQSLLVEQAPTKAKTPLHFCYTRVRNFLSPGEKPLISLY
jgi:RNA recognition motif-containing protein